jgi:hypothetical protein
MREGLTKMVNQKGETCTICTRSTLCLAIVQARKNLSPRPLGGEATGSPRLLFFEPR